MLRRLPGQEGKLKRGWCEHIEHHSAEPPPLLMRQQLWRLRLDLGGNGRPQTAQVLCRNPPICGMQVLMGCLESGSFAPNEQHSHEFLQAVMSAAQLKASVLFGRRQEHTAGDLGVRGNSDECDV